VPLHCGALAARGLRVRAVRSTRKARSRAPSLKPGLIELADGGTLFLDEIGEIEPDCR
jgi:transcriptional regulator with GAF, ATPase, and Fis domain